MKKITLSLIATLFLLTGCGGGKTQQDDVVTQNETTKKNETAKPSTTAHKMGEMVKIIDSETKAEIGTLTINDVFLTDSRSTFSDKKADKVVVIDYTYTNTGSEEDLYIYEFANFKVFDKDGVILSTYPAFLGFEVKHPESVGMGRTSSGTAVYALNHESNDIELEYYNNSFRSVKRDLLFKLTAR